MPKKIGGQKCYAVGCSYGRRGYTGPKRYMFHFPEDAERHAMWVAAIRRANAVPGKHSSLCEAHFERRFIRDGYVKTNPDGTIVYTKRRKAVLREDAVPSIFFDDKYVRTNPGGGGRPEKEALPEDLELTNPLVEVLTIQPELEFPESDRDRHGMVPARPPRTFGVILRLPSFEALVRLFENPSKIPDVLRIDPKWTVSARRPGPDGKGAGVLLFQLDPHVESPLFLKCLRIDSDLTANAFYRTWNVSAMLFPQLMQSTDGSKIATWNDMLTLVDLLDDYDADRYRFSLTASLNHTEEYGGILRLMNERKQQLLFQRPVNREEVSKLSFHMEQLALLGLPDHQRCYTEALRKWTETVHQKSKEAFTFLNTSGSLTLPDVTKALPLFDAADELPTSENIGLNHDPRAM